MTTILLLTLSNIFMTFAWYGHLKYRNAPLFKVIVISWLNCLCGILFSGTRQPHRLLRIHAAQLKTDSGGDHANCVLGLLGALFASTAEVELFCGLRHDDRRGRGDF